MTVTKTRSPLLSPLALVAFLGLGAPPAADAEVPTGPPTFTNPLVIDNEWFPFEVGAVKMFRGKADGERISFVDDYSDATRTFSWNATTVETRLLREVEFEEGEIVEISYNWFAQADDGTVYYFGETVDDYEDGEVVAHEGSWLVGGPTLPGDPAETATATDPAVFMPGNPEIDDQWKPEDLFPLVDETVTFEKVVKKVKVEAGKYTDVMQVKETSDIDPGSERKWYARGVGVIKTKGKGEKVGCIASTLLETEEE